MDYSSHRIVPFQFQFTVFVVTNQGNTGPGAPPPVGDEVAVAGSHPQPPIFKPIRSKSQQVPNIFL